MIVEKKIKDMTKYINSPVTQDMIHTIITQDTDVYTEDGKLLCLFRKKKLKKSDLFFDNVAFFTNNSKSKNRGKTSGYHTIYNSPSVKSSILGYFDKWAPNQKQLFKKKGVKPPLEVRETQFVSQYPEKFKNIIPFLTEIDVLYKKYLPEQYSRQYKKAKSTPFKIGNTSFTTVTTNINFQTTIHKDSGDDDEGFGNLCVIEKGEYTGGETCFPQYGIGIDVREGDILFMNVHEWHGNLPLQLKTPEVIRMSVVCYLRKKIWLRTQHKTQRFMKRHNTTVKRILNK